MKLIIVSSMRSGSAGKQFLRSILNGRGSSAFLREIGDKHRKNFRGLFITKNIKILRS